MLTDPFPGNHGAPVHSLLGNVNKHPTGLGELKLNDCGNPVDFNPRDITEGGNMILWHDEKGGMYPWHDEYYNFVDVNTTSTNMASSTTVNVTLSTYMEDATSNATSSTVSNTTNDIAGNTTNDVVGNATNDIAGNATYDIVGNVTSSTVSRSVGVGSFQDEPVVSKIRSISDFDATYIMQHAVDSAASGTTLATGQKVKHLK